MSRGDKDNTWCSAPLWTRFKIFDELATWILFHSIFEVIETRCSFPLPFEIRIFSWINTLTFFTWGLEFLMILWLLFSSARDFGVIFLFSFARGLGMVSFLFRSRFEIVLKTRYFHPLPCEVLIFLIKWYFYPLPPEVRSWSLNDDLLTWLDSGLTLEG